MAGTGGGLWRNHLLGRNIGCNQCLWVPQVLPTETALSKLLTEFIGTFFRVLTFGLTVLSGNPFAAGPKSGDAFIPAIGLGPAPVAPFLGGGAAAAYQIQFPEG